MKLTIIRRTGLALGTIIGAVSLCLIPVSALSQAKSANTSTDQARVQLIIIRGNSEINRRLNTLNTLSSKISSAVKLSSDDKASLSSEVSSEINSLTSLKTKLDADTTLSNAETDGQSIISDYRVYVLVVPKVNLVKTADDQQIAEGELSSLSPKLQIRLNEAQADGDKITSLKSALTSLNSKISAAQAISSKIESGVIGLQPSDYNTSHTVLSGDRNQLRTAQSDIQAAVSSAKVIVTGLKNP